MPYQAVLYPRLASRLQDAMEAARPRITKTDLVRQARGRYTRAQLRAIVEGRIKRPPEPDILNWICHRVGVRVEHALEDMGYDIAVIPTRDVPDELIEAWRELPESGRQLVLNVALVGASSVRQAQRLAPS